VKASWKAHCKAWEPTEKSRGVDGYVLSRYVTISMESETTALVDVSWIVGKVKCGFPSALWLLAFTPIFLQRASISGYPTHTVV
jgi:hypothetical protein